MDDKIFPWLTYFFSFLIASIPFRTILKQSKNSHVLSFTLDFSKAILAAMVATKNGNQFLVQILGIQWNDYDSNMLWVTSLFAVIGHYHSPWLSFNGESGITLALGILTALSPIAALVSLGTYFFVFFYIKKENYAKATIHMISILTSILAATAVQLAVYPVASHLLAGLAIIMIILFRYETEIDALLEKNY